MNTRKINPKTSWSILPRWVKNWEDCAGKPYQKHKPVGHIRDIVRNGQDILSRSWISKKRQERRDYAEKALQSVSHVYPMSPPHTLGELCLEMAEDARLHGGTIFLGYTRVYSDARIDCRLKVRPSDLLSLRRAMYHRPGIPQDVAQPGT